MNLDAATRKKLLEKTIGEGKIYFFRNSADLGGGIGTDNHPHICVKVADRILVMTIVSSQVDTTRAQLIRWGRASEAELPIILQSPANKLTKAKSYVECNNAYECSIEDFVDAIADNNIVDTNGTLSDTDLLAVIMGVLSSDQVPEEIKDLLR